MPMTARSPSITIWTTAKLTEVKSRQSRRPPVAASPANLAPGSTPPADRSADRSAVRLVTGRSRSGPGPRGCRLASGCQGHLEVGNQVLDVLETDAHPQQARVDPRFDQLRFGQLALRRRQRMHDHRVDAAQ